MSYKRRHDNEILGTEKIWIELTLKCNNNMLIGLFYRPPNTNATIDQSFVNSIDLAFNTANDNVVMSLCLARPLELSYNLCLSLPRVVRSVDVV